MFKLITSQMNLLNAVTKFVSMEISDEDIDTRNAARLSYKYPCLINLFVGRDAFRRHKVLSGHTCSLSVAKCLVYPKTNKPASYAWFMVKRDGDIPMVLSKSLLFGSKSELIKANGFDWELNKVTEGEPFLVHAMTVFGKTKDDIRKIHISILSKDTAKKLVYYKKDVAPMMRGFADPAAAVELPILRDASPRPRKALGDMLKPEWVRKAKNYKYTR